MSNDKAAAKDAKDDEAAAPKGKGSKLLVIAIAANLLVTAGGITFAVLQSGKASHAEAPKGDKAKGEHGGGEEKGEEKEEEPEEKAEEKEEAKEEKGEAKEGSKEAEGLGAVPMMHIENIVVHLRNPEIDRYARIALDVELRRPQDLPVIQAHMPEIRDSIITVLSDRAYEDLRGSDGLGTFKHEVAEKIGEAVGKKRVKAVYISDFVVQ